VEYLPREYRRDYHNLHLSSAALASHRDPRATRREPPIWLHLAKKDPREQENVARLCGHEKLCRSFSAVAGSYLEIQP
jgi:hypothetical protein